VYDVGISVINYYNVIVVVGTDRFRGLYGTIGTFFTRSAGKYRTILPQTLEKKILSNYKDLI